MTRFHSFPLQEEKNMNFLQGEGLRMELWLDGAGGRTSFSFAAVIADTAASGTVVN